MPKPFEFEHYQLVKNEDGSFVELGRGAMGITYKGVDTNLRCNVALKVIASSLLEDKTAAERFLREARSAAQLRHRNVASVFHLGRHGDGYFYAMEFIDGVTVEALVKRDGPLDYVFALDIAQQVACALIAADKQHLVHRDIKPSNLMLVRESDDEVLVKVIDFGLVKSVLMEPTTAGPLTLSGFVGTPYFASPEQLDRQPEDVRSDIYSLGVTLWYMLTGKPTFTGSVGSVIAQHLERSPPFESLAILPAKIVALLRRMLEKDRQKRIQTPSEVREELKSCIENIRVSQPSGKPQRVIDSTLETIALSSIHDVDFSPQAGSLLTDRYRLIEDIDPANPGRTFHAEDTASRMRVTVRVLRGELAAIEQIEQEANRIRSAPHPNLVHVFAVERTKNFSFVVLEWLEGFSLVDLLRARRSLTLRETLMLLKQIAPVVDEARTGNLRLEMNLRDILVHFPEGFAEPTADVVLHCPLDEWPAFVVKMNALWNADDLDALATRAVTPSQKQQHNVVHLGIITYELLGGKAGALTPLANLSEEGNRVLRDCLTPGSSFPTARDFYAALSNSANAKPMPLFGGRKPSEPERPQTSRSERSPSKSALTASAPSALPASRPTPTSKKNALPIAATLICFFIVGGLGWFFAATSLKPTLTPLAGTPSPSPAQAAVYRAPPQPGKPWTNSLEMRFVPLGNIHLAVWQTRVRDFEAFVQATGYDAIGGMSSVVIQNGFKLNDMSWKNPGFVQTSEHPVIGISWEDANQFCAWLTRKETQ
jgi:serine/threonine protein kinase